MKVTGTDRHKKILRRCAVAFATVSILAAMPSAAMAVNVRLFIDPGHGGKDPGAVAGGLREKDTNLKISKLIYKSAKRQGWAVKMSRTRDTFVPLTARPRMAAKFRATDFVSIHSNSAGSKRSGNMTIYRNKASWRLGSQIMREMDALTRYPDIGNRRDSRGLAVLKGARMPAVIVEVLSVSSPGERKALKNPKVQALYAEAIVKGVARQHGVKYVPPAAPKPVAKPIPKVESKPDPKLEVDIAESVAKAKKPEASFAQAVNGKKAPRSPKAAQEKNDAESTKMTERPVTTSETAPTKPSEPVTSTPQWLATLIAIFNG